MSDTELNAAVAERVMGWKFVRVEQSPMFITPNLVAIGDIPTGGYRDTDGFHRGTNEETPLYSTDIAAAFEVVEKLLEIEYVKVRLSGSHYHGWSVSVTAPDESQNPRGIKDVAAIMEADLPRAICLAALRAVEAKEANP